MSKDGIEIRRRRECLGCQNRFTTYEKLEQVEMRVVKRTGIREAFTREKLLGSLIKACEKRPVPTDVLEHAADDVCAELASNNVREIPTRMIGPLIMQHLQEIDPVAYVRYASVYRRFEDIGEFIDEIQSFEQRPKEDTSQQELFVPSTTAS